MEKVFDVAIIGGGINGCASAADAALRGLSVVLFEKDDLASKTSSSSTKLIHGGLRYLEYYEFGLVRKALIERQRLLDLAPHLVHRQQFVLPYQKKIMRPAWLLKLGLILYDNLSFKNKLPRHKTLYRNKTADCFAPLKETFTQGFSFYDAVTDDARLTIMNALQAKEHGASIRTHSLVMEVTTKSKLWQLTIQPKFGQAYTIKAKALINAAGPWVQSLAHIANIPKIKEMTLVKGSHIVVPKLYPGSQAYLLQHEDKRVVFVIPYQGFTLLGTTDVAFHEPLERVEVSQDEIEYLTTLVNAYFNTMLSKQDVLYSWSGVRPLISEKNKDMSAISRDYYFEFTQTPAPVITIYSGKITTYRQLAQEAIDHLKIVFPKIKPSQTKTSHLPGASFASMNYSQYSNYAKKQYAWLNPKILHRYLLTYGTLTEKFLSHCTNYKSLGQLFGSSLYQVEVDYLVREEWAKDCDDILKRRTKLILEMDLKSQQALADYLASSINCSISTSTA